MHINSQCIFYQGDLCFKCNLILTPKICFLRRPSVKVRDDAELVEFVQLCFPSKHCIVYCYILALFPC